MKNLVLVVEHYAWLISFLLMWSVPAQILGINSDYLLNDF